MLINFTDLVRFKQALAQGRVVNRGRPCNAITGMCSCGAWHDGTEIKNRIHKTKKPGPKLEIVRGGK